MNIPIVAQTPVKSSGQVAYNFGAEDAKRGAICCPEMVFTQRGDKMAYCRGYEAVAGATLTTRQFLA